MLFEAYSERLFYLKNVPAFGTITFLCADDGTGSDEPNRENGHNVWNACISGMPNYVECGVYGDTDVEVMKRGFATLKDELKKAAKAIKDYERENF
jgi:hypothetical protein